MQFGVSLSLSLKRDVVASARAAEEAGFDFVASGEHLMFHGPTTNAFVSLAAAAGATERVRLVSAATLVPMYPPALLAKLAATLDVVSGGRFTLGVGIGGENPREFEAVGVPPRERGARADEALAVLRRLLAGETVTHEGRFFRLHEVRIDPPPVRGRLPIWVAGRREPAMRRAARFGDGWMPYMYTPDQLRRSLETIAALCAEQGRAPSEITPVIFAFTTLRDDPEDARAVAIPMLREIYRQDFSGMTDRMVVGSPQECRARLRAFRDAGARAAVLSLICPPEEGPAMMRRLAREVLPDLGDGP